MKIVIADDHPIAALGVQSILSDYPHLKIVAIAENSTELFAALQKYSVDIVITDYAMPGGAYGDGMEMLNRIHQRFPSVKVIVLTVLSNVSILNAIAHAGVRGLLNKSSELKEIPLAIDRVSGGLTYFGKTVQLALSAQMLRPEIKELNALSPKELEVVRLFLTGASIPSIAEALHRSRKTISNQKRAAMIKLGCSTDLDLFNYHLLTGMTDVAQPDRESENGASATGPKP